MIKQRSTFPVIFLILLCIIQLQCTKEAHKVSNKAAINSLKEGCLIVRLKTHKKKIEKLQKMGFREEAKKKKLKIKTENQGLMAAFKQDFKFCPVYFIKSEDSHFLLNRENWKGLFLNDKLKRDATIQPKCKDFLTAELGETTGENSISALVIMSDEFIPKQRPFPTYVRRNIFGFTKSYSKIVRQLNQKFYTYSE